ncbi:MAG TPA: hypothetical protein VFA75_09020 [Nevskia sp.]|nr:hypothetical protein [Nevskia sp.]
MHKDIEDIIAAAVERALEARASCPCNALTEAQVAALGPMAEAYLEDLEIKRLRREAWQKVRAFGPMAIIGGCAVWALLWTVFGAKEGTVKFLHWAASLFGA